MKIMAVDYGDSRTGLAMCDKGEVLASPLYTINMKDFDRCLEMTAEAARENKAELIVVGNPINMNGTEGPRSEKCRLFADRLKELVGGRAHVGRAFLHRDGDRLHERRQQARKEAQRGAGFRGGCGHSRELPRLEEKSPRRGLRYVCIP